MTWELLNIFEEKRCEKCAIKHACKGSCLQTGISIGRPKTNKERQNMSIFIYKPIKIFKQKRF